MAPCSGSQPTVNMSTVATVSETNGCHPYAGLTLGDDGAFYGTTSYGSWESSARYGTVFRVTTNGELSTVVLFDGTNGFYPYAALTLGPDGAFYGSTHAGGNSRRGNIFRVTTRGQITTLYSFGGPDEWPNTSPDPYGKLVFGNGGALYGTTYSWGVSNLGTVFRVTTNGAFTSLVSFTGANGAHPYASLAPGEDGALYGTTMYGGTHDQGTIFRVTTNGDLTTLVSLDASNGAGRGQPSPLGRTALSTAARATSSRRASMTTTRWARARADNLIFTMNLCGLVMAASSG